MESDGIVRSYVKSPLYGVQENNQLQESSWKVDNLIPGPFHS